LFSLFRPSNCLLLLPASLLLFFWGTVSRAIKRPGQFRFANFFVHGSLLLRQFSGSPTPCLPEYFFKLSSVTPSHSMASSLRRRFRPPARRHFFPRHGCKNGLLRIGAAAGAPFSARACPNASQAGMPSNFDQSGCSRGNVIYPCLWVWCKKQEIFYERID
jgi:hypothetical protein